MPASSSTWLVLFQHLIVRSIVIVTKHWLVYQWTGFNIHELRDKSLLTRWTEARANSNITTSCHHHLIQLILTVHIEITKSQSIS